MARSPDTALLMSALSRKVSHVHPLREMLHTFLRHSSLARGVVNSLKTVKIRVEVTGGLPQISSSWRQVPWTPRPEFFFQLNPCGSYLTGNVLRHRYKAQMLFRETVAVYCENLMEHTDTLCGQNADL
jgi:hypothetical protein